MTHLPNARRTAFQSIRHGSLIFFALLFTFLHLSLYHIVTYPRCSFCIHLFGPEKQALDHLNGSLLYAARGPCSLLWGNNILFCSETTWPAPHGINWGGISVVQSFGIPEQARQPGNFLVGDGFGGSFRMPLLLGSLDG